MSGFHSAMMRKAKNNTLSCFKTTTTKRLESDHTETLLENSFFAHSKSSDTESLFSEYKEIIQREDSVWEALTADQIIDRIVHENVHQIVYDPSIFNLSSKAEAVVIQDRLRKVFNTDRINISDPIFMEKMLKIMLKGEEAERINHERKLAEAEQVRECFEAGMLANLRDKNSDTKVEAKSKSLHKRVLSPSPDCTPQVNEISNEPAVGKADVSLRKEVEEDDNSFLMYKNAFHLINFDIQNIKKLKKMIIVNKKKKLVKAKKPHPPPDPAPDPSVLEEQKGQCLTLCHKF